METLDMGHHISRRYNEELEDIRNRVLAMGGVVEQQLQDAMASLENQDARLAASVVENDFRVNAMEVAIDEECNLVLARRQPAARDLRLVVAVIKTITDLERIGDEAERIARMASRLAGEEGVTRLFTQIHNLGQHVRGMLHGALDAFAHLDTGKAVEVWSEDRFVDREYESLMRALMTYMMEDASSIPCVLQAMFAARAIARLSDVLIDGNAHEASFQDSPPQPKKNFIEWA